MQKTKIQIIEETVEFYTHNPRSVTNFTESYNRCLYKGGGNKECAFQRVVETNLSRFDQIGTAQSCTIVMQECNVEFKDGYEGHAANFWQDIQLLHDSADNWINRYGPGGGLTEDGESELDRLRIKYSQNSI